MLLSSDISVCCLTETFLNSTDSFGHSDFITYRLDRDSPNRGGGKAICVKRGLKHKLLPNASTRVIESLSIEFYTSRGSFVVYTIYFSGSNNADVLVDFRSDIRLLSSMYRDHIITGDFDCRHSFWGCQRSNSAGRILNDEMLRNQFLWLHPSEPTHYPVTGSTPSILDFFLVVGSYLPDDIEVRNELSSDHLPVICTLATGFETLTSQY